MVNQRTFDQLQRGINERQSELQVTADILAKRAERYSRISLGAKVALVLLGAVSATKAAADQFFGSGSSSSLAVYTAVGLLTATIAGVEAALRLERRSAELAILASDARAFYREMDSVWRETIGAVPSTEKTAGAVALIKLQDRKLVELHDRAARQGFNIAFGVASARRRKDARDGPYPA